MDSIAIPIPILSLGAATNIAIVIKKYPELVNRIEELVAMPGSRTSPEELFLVGSEQIKPFTALNFEADVEAWRSLIGLWFVMALRSTLPVQVARGLR